MLNFEICDDVETLWRTPASWNDLAAGNPFRQTQWIVPWWKNCGGADHTAAIVAARDSSGVLRGALPLYRHHGTGTLGVMTDGSVCGDFLGPLCGPNDQTCADSVHIARSMGVFLGEIAGDSRHGWSMLDFQGGVEGDPLFAAFVDGLQSTGCTNHLSSRMSCWRKTKDETWADHLRHYGKTQRRRMRRWLEMIDGPSGITRCLVNDADEFESLVNDVMDLHQRRWNDVGEPGSFADPSVRKFAVDTMLAFFADGQSMVNAIALDGQTIAGELIIIGRHRVAHTYSSGYDIDHADLEPGRIVGTDLLHQMYDPASRFDAIEYMRGDETYKRRLSSESRRLYHLHCFAPAIRSRLRSAAYHTHFNAKQIFRRITGRDQVTVTDQLKIKST